MPRALRVEYEGAICHVLNRGNCREFSRRLETRRREDEDSETLKEIRRGWRFGAEDFLDRLQDAVAAATAERHESAYVKDAATERVTS